MTIPVQPKNSFRVVLELANGAKRLDSPLLEALRAQDRNDELKRLSRTAFKKLFDEKRIQIKGQNAKPSSALAKGTTYIDILGYDE